jgi:hypothetical protein
MLTTGQDNITGTTGNDTILGLVGTGATFTLGDAINGGAGTDTLKLTSDARTVNLATATISGIENVEINLKATGAPGAAGTAGNAATVDLNSLALEKAVIEGVTGDDATTVSSDTLTVNNAHLSTRVVLKDIKDVASTVNFVGASGSADTATVEIAKATETTTTGNNNLTVANIETLNLAFTTGTNTLNVVSAAQAKTVNVSVASGANTTWAAAAALGNVTALNIDAAGNFTLGETANLGSDAVITVKGSGNVNLDTLEGDKTITGGSVDASQLTGKLTVVGHDNTASITGGSGADTITSAANTTVVVAGDGNDYVSIGAVNYGAPGSKTVSGGAGRDTLNITASANLTAATMANVTGFEVLDIRGSNGTDGSDTGNGDYNVDGRGFEEVTIGAALTKAAKVSGITSEALTITANQTQAVMYALKNNTSSDTIKVTIAGAQGAGTDGVLGTSDDKNDLTVARLVTDGIETITIESNTAAGNVAGEKNTITALDAKGATKLVVTGNHALEITGFYKDGAYTDTTDGAYTDTTVNDSITTIDASASKGLIMGGGLATTSALSITGSAYADTIVVDAASTNGSTINAGKGGDTITLGANSARDTLILQAGDSQIGYIDANKDGAFASASDKVTFDVVTGFTSGEDLIDLGAFGFTGLKKSGLAGATLTEPNAVKLVNGTTTTIANFFVDTGITRGVAVVTGDFSDIGGNGTNDTLVFIDVNGNGNLDTNADMMVLLVGADALALSDFGF